MKIFEKEQTEGKTFINVLGFPIFYSRDDGYERYTRLLCFKWKSLKNNVVQIEEIHGKSQPDVANNKRNTSPDVSIIIPVYNAESFISDCLITLKDQSNRNLEFILIDDASKDQSKYICEKFAKGDARFKVISLAHNVGVAAARNLGMSIAKGKYIGFVDPDDLIDKDYFGRLYRKARLSKADIVINTNIQRIDCNRKVIGKKNSGVSSNIILKNRDKLRVALTTGVTWNKIYSRNFLVEHQILFPEIKTMGTDNLITWIGLMEAKKVVSFDGAAYFYRENPNSIIRKRKDESYYKLIDVYERIYQRICLSNVSDDCKKLWLRGLRSRIVTDSLSNLKGFDEERHKEEFLNYVSETFPDIELSTKIQPIISVTSYPGRIETVHKVITSLKKQRAKYKKIVLWLAEAQFPKKERDLPEKLLGLLDNKFEICWCAEDIRSYKKLIPALKVFPNDIIVTADDDIEYPEDWLERLVNSYQDEPDAIHCLRGRNIKIDKDINKGLRPYSEWRLVSNPLFSSYNTLLTGAGGCLYRKGLLSPEVMDTAKCTTLCPDADDLWFWAMAINNGTKIKVARPPLIKLAEINGSQETSLWSKNKTHNDEVIKKILTEYPKILDILNKE